jgi:hypothetical protein
LGVNVSSGRSKWLVALLGAVLAPPAAAYLSSALAYDFGNRSTAALWPLVLALLGVMVGLAALSNAPFRQPVVRLAAQVVYVPLALGGAWFTLLLAACSFGDCI